MKLANLVLVAATLFVLPVYGMINVGDSMPNLSWKDSEDRTITLDETKGSVRVLLYNGGFCAPCNAEFSELVPRVGVGKLGRGGGRRRAHGRPR